MHDTHMQIHMQSCTHKTTFLLHAVLADWFPKAGKERSTFQGPATSLKLENNIINSVWLDTKVQYKVSVYLMAKNILCQNVRQISAAFTFSSCYKGMPQYSSKVLVKVIKVDIHTNTEHWMDILNEEVMSRAQTHILLHIIHFISLLTTKLVVD